MPTSSPSDATSSQPRRRPKQRCSPGKSLHLVFDPAAELIRTASLAGSPPHLLAGGMLEELHLWWREWSKLPKPQSYGIQAPCKQLLSLQREGQGLYKPGLPGRVESCGQCNSRHKSSELTSNNAQDSSSIDFDHNWVDILLPVNLKIHQNH